MGVISKILKSTFRECDISFRYGGEEFIVMLPETGITPSLQAANRIVEAVRVESARQLADICDHGVTISVGVSVYPRDGESESDLFKVVDDMLYRAKAAGKDRFCHLKK